VGKIARLADRLNKPKALVWFHGVRTLVWVALMPIALLTDLKYSIPFVIFLSLEALVETALSAWQGARAEVASSD
jgi:hypothetical protein